MLKKFLLLLILAVFAALPVMACTENEIDVLGDGLQCEEAKFKLTTTSDISSFSFTISAKGTFYVDCGNGGTLSGTGANGKTINRTNTTGATYTCSWTGSATTQTIRFGGLATGYSTANPSYPDNSNYNESGKSAIGFRGAPIVSIVGNFSKIFPIIPEGNLENESDGWVPKFMETFQHCSSLEEISGDLFKDYTEATPYMFWYTFQYCSKLNQIPSNLFAGFTNTVGATGMFWGAFRECESLTSLPSGLFASIKTGANSMFRSAFNRCTSLTTIPGDLFADELTTDENCSYIFGNMLSSTKISEIPEDLFAGIQPGGEAEYMFEHTFAVDGNLTTIPPELFKNIKTGKHRMFYNTFYGCTNLTSIPENLFSTITTSAGSMFEGTFGSCTNLSGYIPSSTFAGLIANGSPTASNMWYNTFSNTGLVTSCPSGTVQYITGYEGTTNGTTWNGKVSCVCATGYHLDATSDAPTCKPNTITINWSDVAEGESTTTVQYDGDIQTPIKAVEKPGYIFKGWKFSKAE